MRVEVLSQSKPIARKDHDCMACEWLNNSGIINGGVLSFSEYRSYVKAKRNKFKIKKGDKYIRQNNKYDEELYTFKGIPEIDDICHKYDLYEV